MSQVTTLEWGASQRAALDHGKPMVYVCPPAGWAARALFERMAAAEASEFTALRTLCLVPDAADALDLAAALADAEYHHPLHASTGLTRTERLLRAGAITTLLVTPADALELTKRAALKTDSLEHVLIMWPERFDASAREALDSLLSETRALQRIVVTEDPKQSTDIIERQARRAPVATFAAMPDEKSANVQFALVDPDGRMRALRAALDVSTAERTLVWLPYPMTEAAATINAPDVDLLVGSEVEAGPESPAYERVIVADLPTPGILHALRGRARECVVLVRPAQLSYLERMVAQARPLRLPAAVDRARDRILALRNRLRAQAESADLTGHLMAIEPLLEEFDPTVLAAAALAGWQVAPPTLATWTHLHVNIGRRDGVRPGDFVGLLLNAVGLRREDVGRIDLRDQFSLIEIRPEDADRVISGLAGQTIRGRRIVARLDRR